MDPMQLEAAEASVKQDLEWHTGSIICQLTSSDTGQVEPFDLSAAISKNRSPLLIPDFTVQGFMRSCHFFPESTSSNKDSVSKKERVSGILELACKDAGFQLVARNKDSIKNGDLFRHTYKCVRSRFKSKSRIDPSDRKRVKKSNLCLPGDDKCPFSISIYEEPTSGRFFIPKCGIPGNLTHKGHFKLPSQAITVSTKSASPEQIENVVQQLSMHIQPSQISKLLEIQTGIRYSSAQIRHLRSFGDHLKLTTGSAAIKLLHNLQSTPGIRFIYETAYLTEANQITIRNYSGVDLVDLSLAGNTSGLSSTTTDGAPRKLSTKEIFCKAVLNALKLPCNNQLLLCVAWVTDQQVNFLQKYPEVISIDTTFGTNAEKRPLARATALHADGRKTIPFFNCFMSSESSWQWDWIVSVAFPALIDRTTLSRVRLLLTDQDYKCYEQLDTSIKFGCFPNAMHRLCHYHKIDFGFVTPTMKFKTSDDNTYIIEGTAAFLYALIDVPESELELNFYFEQYGAWLKKSVNEKIVTTAVETFIRNFVGKSFWCHRHKLCYSYFKHLPGGKCKSSIYSEVENSRLKRCSYGTRANLGLHDSQDAIQQVESEALNKLSASDWKGLTATDSSTVGGLTERLSSLLNTFAVRMLLQQHKLAEKFWCCRDEFGKFLVRRKQPDASHCVKTRSTRKHLSIADEILPILWRTRSVEVVDGHLRCDCGFFVNNGIACRHFFAVTGVEPAAHHCSARHLKKFATHYGINLDFTKIVDDSLSHLLQGVPVSNSLCLPSLATPSELAWYKEGMGVCLAPNSPYYTDGNNSIQSRTAAPTGLQKRDATPLRCETATPLSNDGFDGGDSDDSPFDDDSKPSAKITLRDLHEIADELVRVAANSNKEEECYEELASLMARFKLEGELATNSSGKILSFPESEKKEHVPRKRSLDEKFRAAGQKKHK
jgi:MULE transposase domain